MSDAIGFLSFTEVTDPTAHPAYNAWHQLDHQPEQFSVAGVRFGQRWVSTPACRQARVASGPELDAIQYLTLYLMGPPFTETLDDFWDLAQELHAAGRFFEPRRSLLNGPFAVADMRTAADVAVRPEVLPYRPNRGLYVSIERRDTPGTGEELAALASVEGVSGVWRVAGARSLERHGWDVAGWEATLCFLDDDPLAVAPRVVAALEPRWREQGRPPALAGPFETITPWRWDWFESASAVLEGHRDT